MEENKINLNVVPGSSELIIRHADALDEQPIPSLSIIGGRGTVMMLILMYPEIVQGNHSVIKLDYGSRRLQLIINPQGGEKEKTGEVITKYTETETFKILGLNSKYWPPKELGNFLRLNEHILSPVNTDVKEMVGNLRNLEVEFERKSKETNNDRGNTTLNRSQVITKCNIPKKITFLIPLFENEAEQPLEADVEIDPDTLKIILIVPDLNKIIKEKLELLLEGECEEIRDHEVGKILPIFYVG